MPASLLKHISDDDLKTFCDTSMSWKEMFQKCGYKHRGEIGVKRRIKKRLDKLQISHIHLDRTPVFKMSQKEVSDLLLESTTWYEFVVEKLKFRYLSSNSLAITQEVLGQMQLSCEHLGEPRNKNGKKVRPQRPHIVLEKRLEEDGRLKICEWCRCEAMDDFDDGQWIWCGRPLTLEIDHIHGKGFPGCDDPRNLRYVYFNL